VYASRCVLPPYLNNPGPGLSRKQAKDLLRVRGGDGIAQGALSELTS